MDRYSIASRAFIASVVWLLGAAHARAASLQKVDQATWGSGNLPSYVNMYVYAPETLASKPPILVASHHCGGSASSTYNETKSSFVSLADKQGFVIIFPEATGHNCWDVGSDKSLKHDGGGDTQAVAQMVRYALSKYDGDASRVYAFGTSSGGMMTQALLGVYPDVFTAGVAVAGVPCGCWAEQYSGDSGANPQWSGPCAGGQVDKTAQVWGDQARAMFPGFAGHRPRIQLWHGTTDTTISFKNLAESVKQWTNVLGLGASPTASDNARAGYDHQTWKNTCGYIVLETWAQRGAGHDVTWDAANAASFLGLDTKRTEDPEAAACSLGSQPNSSAGNSGSAAAGSSPGNSSAGSSSTAGNNAVNGGSSGARAQAPGSAGASATKSTAGSVAVSSGTSSVQTATSSPAVSGTPNDTSAMRPSVQPAMQATSDTSGSLASGCSVGVQPSRPSPEWVVVLCACVALTRRSRRWAISAAKPRGAHGAPMRARRNSPHAFCLPRRRVNNKLKRQTRRW